MARSALATLVVLMTVLLTEAGILADHEDFRYKWPWYAGVSAPVTTLPYQGVHQCDDPQTQEIEVGSCTDAFDFDISDYNVIAGAEGTIVDFRNDIPSSECNPAQGLGNYVEIQDSNGLSPIYAHLASVVVASPFQGDLVGVQGHTGHTVGSDPGTINGVPYANCGDHLHWEFGSNNPSSPVHPTPIDGGNSGSSNVQIGDTDIDPVGEFIRDQYTLFEGWNTVGFVSDAGRGLPMHRHGAGWEQNFASHDDQTGTRQSGIYVPDRIADAAFWVLPEFWDTYENVTGGAIGWLQYPAGDELVPCPLGAPTPCDAYQDFECGFIWRNGSSILSEHTCAGLYAITGEYRRLSPEEAGWGVEDEDTPPGGSQNLKSFGELMVHKEGISSGQGFFVSQDGGETWSATAKPLDDVTFRPVDADFCPGSPPRLWMAWQDWGGTSTYNYLRIYYSDDYGATFTQSASVSIGGIGGTPAHPNGSVTCDPTDPNRVAVVVQRGSSSRVRVTTNGGLNWSTYGVGSLANAFRMVWSDGRLVLVYDNASAFTILKSDNYGVNWTTAQTFTNDSGRTTNVDVIATSVSGLLFAFFDPTSPDHVLRSTDNGTTWEQVGALPSGLLQSAGIRAVTYDGENDYVYAVWNTGEVVLLRNASTIDWDAVTASDWITLPSLGGIHIRSLALDGSGSLGLLGP